MTLKSAPVRATAATKVIAVASTNPMRSVSSRTWEPNAGSSAAATAAPRPGSARVSGTSSQATAAASKPASQSIDQERRGKADALGEQAARQRAHAHREQEDALVDGHGAAAIGAVVTSASTIWPPMRVSAAPAPATKRPPMKRAYDGA
jgi:uncharacterized protein involved in type VI secretion and phage assembly